MVIKMIEVITPSSSLYDDSRHVWNMANDKFPAAIAYCKNYDDIKKSILFARRNKKKIRVRSRGNNYCGFSSDDDSFVIDIRNLNEVQINYENKTFTVQGGASAGSVYSLLNGYGYSFPGPSFSNIGISGSVLGGGWSYSSRYLGLSCDSLLEAKLINCDGSLITVNRKINSDLFWALKGAGGGNFGIVVSMTFSLPPKADLVTTFNFYSSSITIENQIKFFNIWQDWISSCPDTINMKCSIINSAYDGPYIYCTGLIYGTPDELINILNPFMSIDGFNLNYENVSPLQASEVISSFYNQSGHFNSYSRFVSNNYSYDEVSSLINIINAPIPDGASSIMLNLYGLGGKIKEVGKYDTAFYYRDSKYIVSLESDFEDNSYAKNINDWIELNSRYIHDITDGSYINFSHYPLDNYLNEYYGENADRLKRINQKYDPLNIFTFKQGIK